MDIAFIVESALTGGRDPALAGARPSVVLAERPFTLTLIVTSEDGDGPQADTDILTAVHLCAWTNDDDFSRSGIEGFTSGNIPIEGRVSSSIPLTLPASGDTVTTNIQFIPPSRGAHYRIVLNVHFYLASNGAPVGHLARALTVVQPNHHDPELLNAVAR